MASCYQKCLETLNSDSQGGEQFGHAAIYTLLSVADHFDTSSDQISNAALDVKRRLFPWSGNKFMREIVEKWPHVV